MPSGTISRTLRPIRLVFVVPYDDEAALLASMRMNTFLWGGLFNPIVPYFRKRPARWFDDGRSHSSESAQDVLTGFVEIFDPDYVVVADGIKEDSVSTASGGRQVLRMSEMERAIGSNKPPPCGLGLFQFARHFYEEELKYTRRHPPNIMRPMLSNTHRMFWTSVLGDYPTVVAEAAGKALVDGLGAVEGELRLNELPDMLRTGTWHPLALTSYALLVSRSVWGQDTRLLLMDATSWLDVLDYWNLRAAFFDVLPLPVQALREDRVMKSIERVANEVYRPDPRVRGDHVRLELVKARSVSTERWSKFTNEIPSGLGDRLRERGWYPRIWTDEDQSIDMKVASIHAVKDEIDVPSAEHIAFRPLLPSWMPDRLDSHWGAFANELEFSFRGESDPAAEVVPPDFRDAGLVLGPTIPTHWRTGQGGLVYLASSKWYRESIGLPKAERVMLRWLRVRGLVCEISPPGRTARLLLSRLGGLSGASLLATRQGVRLLNKIAGCDNQAMLAGEVVGRLKQALPRDQGPHSVDGFIRGLIDAGLLQMCLRVQCPVCSKHGVFALGVADHKVTCPNCQEEFRLPTHAPREIECVYQARPPFGAPGKADGALTVLLAYRFFSQMLSGSTTPLMSFTLRRPSWPLSKKVEVDLALLWKPFFERAGRPDMVLAECKMFRRFERKDVVHLGRAAREFPGSVIVFATLNDRLTEDEKRLIAPLATRAVSARRRRRPFSRVVVLTGTELCAPIDLRMSWSELGGEHKRMSEYHYMESKLTWLAETTQHLYLGVDPWAWRPRIDPKDVAAEVDMLEDDEEPQLQS